MRTRKKNNFRRMPPGLMSFSDFANAVGCSRSRVHYWNRKGKLPVVQYEPKKYGVIFQVASLADCVLAYLDRNKRPKIEKAPPAPVFVVPVRPIVTIPCSNFEPLYSKTSMVPAWAP